MLSILLYAYGTVCMCMYKLLLPNMCNPTTLVTKTPRNFCMIAFIYSFCYF
uniref:Uncharacterized protein n=1 Tax=Arundo donax TaxID=35708 RepID=A0A0A9N6N3_ARUDO